MSFKLKRWAKLRTVDLQDFIPGCRAYQTPGGAGINTHGYSCPWQGKIVCMVYASDDTPIWTIYDPATDSIGAVHEHDMHWNLYAPSYGWTIRYRWWGNTWLAGIGSMYGFYVGYNVLWGWDADLQFHDSRMPSLWMGYGRILPSTRMGSADGQSVTKLYYLSNNSDPSVDSAVARCTLGGGPEIVYQGDDIYVTAHDGSLVITWADLGGGYYYWPFSGEITSGGVCAGIPASADDCLAFGSFGSTWTGYPPATRQMQQHPQGGSAYIYVDSPDLNGGEPFWAAMGAPLTPVELPWRSHWHYRQLGDGGYDLDEDDLDGIDHGVSEYGPGEMPVTFSDELGWYVGVEDVEDAVRFDVFVLDPFQPSHMPTVNTEIFSPPAGWVGEWAIRDDLAIQHVLPFPDERAPSGSSVKPPVVRSDGYILGSKELFQLRNNKIEYIRDVKINVKNYPYTSSDFRWPTTEDGYLDLNMELWAGGNPTIVGRMPDYMWGMYSPVGHDIGYGLGYAVEHFTDSDSTHTLKDSQRISGTNFATPLSGTLTQVRRQLIDVGDNRYAYCESGIRLGAPPRWNAVVGHIAGSEWTTDIDFEDIGPPGLGETDWWVWSVVPIPRCAALPQGGWLVGATLDFNFWSEWEWTRGTPTSFVYKSGVDTGKNYCPSLPSYEGPLQVENAPVLLSAYDEWTANRSLYGPDALLVYDHEGTFVDCLNDDTIYPPNGKEIMVVPGTVPRVIYRAYRYGTYSDNAEYWGCYCGSNFSDIEVQAPIYVCMALLHNGKIRPGGGGFIGFVGMHALRQYATTGASWRWETCCPSIYDFEYPKQQWSPPGASYVRAGLGGRGITLLSPGPGKTKTGLKGVAARCRL